MLSLNRGYEYSVGDNNSDPPRSQYSNVRVKVNFLCCRYLEQWTSTYMYEERHMYHRF